MNYANLWYVRDEAIKAGLSKIDTVILYFYG